MYRGGPSGELCQEDISHSSKEEDATNVYRNNYGLLETIQGLETTFAETFL